MNTSSSENPLFNQLKDLLTEQRNPETTRIDLADAEQIVRWINKEDARVAGEVEKKIPVIAEAVEVVKEAISEGGRLLYFGAGTSGRLGVLDAAECPPTFGTQPETVQGFIAGGKEAMFVAQEGSEDYEANGAEDLEKAGASPPDVICGLAASGRTPYVHGALKKAAELGCKTIFITTVPAEQIEIEVDLLIDIPVGPEVIMGSTRMKSATAQKMVLNMITTGAMVRLGKVYENVMVDLQLTNKKLEERAKRILMFLGEVSYLEADGLLKDADGHVKTALLMALTGLSRTECQKLLIEHGGFIRKALQNFSE
ncbi:MAG: N-acetylmuramic acid 6-phosphate etherase [Balneolaceae bacterium]